MVQNQWLVRSSLEPNLPDWDSAALTTQQWREECPKFETTFIETDSTMQIMKQK